MSPLATGIGGASCPSGGSLGEFGDFADVRGCHRVDVGAALLNLVVGSSLLWLGAVSLVSVWTDGVNSKDLVDCWLLFFTLPCSLLDPVSPEKYEQSTFKLKLF